MTFTHYLSRRHTRSTLELLALASTAKADEELDPNVFVELELEVFYNPGWYQPAKLSGHPDTWAPAEGEDAEITSVMLTKANGEQVEFINELTREEFHTLIEAANRAAERDDDYGCDPDAYDYARDMAMEDEYYDSY